jgi:nicotinate dehydrogenase subunit A
MATISVNGKSRTVDVDLDTPLLYVLRDELALNGPKFGCGLAQCGACTVLIDGRAVRSCVLPVGKVGAGRVVTLEGLGTPQKPHPVQQAFIEEQAAQCGYCINGMVMQTAAFLGARQTQPSDREIRQALQQNLCRCGTHQRIIAAVKRAAALMGKGA